MYFIQNLLLFLCVLTSIAFHNPFKPIHILKYNMKLYKTNNFSPERIIKHRKIMAKAVGVPVIKYNSTHNYIERYESISEAARQNNIRKEGINNVLRYYAKSAGGYFWRVDDGINLSKPHNMWESDLLSFSIFPEN
jgi:endo-1,4-beta-mannosidase